jgi:GLPGLI family protein
MNMKLIYLLTGVLAACQVQAQQQQGRVVYEFTRQMQLRMAGPEGGGQVLPRTHVLKVEVLFGNNQMLRRQLEEDNVGNMAGEDGGVHIQIGGGGDDDITWLNFAEQRKVEQREFAAKQFLVIDSVRRLNWKLTGESKTILGYTCQQAVTTSYGKRRTMSMENGTMRSKEVPDTSNVVVWFTPAIPVPAGPDYGGQLPGLILEIDINGNTAYKAVEVAAKVDVAAIKEPKGGKKVTAAEFMQERDKMISDMERNGGMRFRARGG